MIYQYRFTLITMTMLDLIYQYDPNRMAWQWAETLVEVSGIQANITGTTK